jgi:CubicO group peptidase (beta-lactamase class C family)
MKYERHCVAGLLLGTVLMLTGCGGGGGSDGGGAANAPPPPPPPAGTIGDGTLDDLVEYVRVANGLPAMGAIVVLRGQIAESAANGRRSADRNRPVTTEDQWHLGSITKSMTSTMAGILVEQSVLTWETRPLDVWPELSTTINEAYRDVTVADLLSHQSRLPVDVTAIPSFGLVQDDAPGSVTAKRYIWASELLTLPPQVSAGSFLYTNAGYIVVGAMMESLTGTAWENLMTGNVFGPLGMTDTGYGAPGTPGQVDEPWGHWFRNGGFTPVSPGPGADNPATIGPAGTVHGTLGDLAKYMLAHIEGERGIPGLLTADTFRFLHSPFGGYPYGMGWNVDDTEADEIGNTLQHGGSNDRWFARFALAPGLEVGLLIVTNAGGPVADSALDELGDLMIDRVRNSL